MINTDKATHQALEAVSLGLPCCFGSCLSITSRFVGTIAMVRCHSMLMRGFRRGNDANGPKRRKMLYTYFI